MMSAALSPASASAGSPAAKPWITNCTALADPRDLGGRFVAVHLHAPQPGPPDDLDDPFRPLVAEDPDGVYFPRKPAHDVAHGLGIDPARARREHEAERVGVERDREQRAVLVRDPADLDEHAGHPISGPALDGGRRHRAHERGGIVGAHEGLADEDRVEAGRRTRCASSAVRIADSATATTSGVRATTDRWRRRDPRRRSVRSRLLIPDHLRACAYARFDLVRAVGLDQHVEAELGLASAAGRRGAVVGQRRDDQQDGVGADGAPS